ncbi:MAG: response regulator [Gemmatimonadetes bacterium]|nr:response regulator [Gemmatimonadota bacterium]
MIVEDDHTDHLLLYSIFAGSGHEIHMARDGEHALKTYLRMDIQVVVTDLHMPNVDGLELIEALLAMYPEASIIAVSGKGPTLLAQAANLGAVATFSKPVAPDELLEAVEKALSSR